MRCSRRRRRSWCGRRCSDERAALCRQPANAARPSTDTNVQVAGAVFVGDPAGALYWPEQGLLAVADLHLEKGSSFAARGVLLPPYDTAATLARLARLIAHYAPRLVVALGDSFHDQGGPARIARYRPRGAADIAARTRMDLDRRQPRSGAGRGHRRQLLRGARV